MASNTWGNLTVKAICVAIGAWAASSLVHSLEPKQELFKLNKPKPVRIAVRAAPAAPVAPVAPAPAVRTAKVLPLKADVAPPKKERPKPKPVPPKAPEAAAAPVEATIAPPQQMAIPPALPTLSQPAIAAPAPMAPVALPPIPGSEVPPAPPEDAQASKYPEKPGGPVLVLELTVNDQGIVIDSRILVPSSQSFTDFALVMAAKGQHWKNITPPLLPGEQRKLEIRIPFEDDNAKSAAPADTLP